MKFGQLTHRSTEELNCVAHYDPGLFSISFFSDNEGLQLLDASGQWVAGPDNTKTGQGNIGVLWLGDAAVQASRKQLPHGVHRVLYAANGKPRLTLWFEVCTMDQVDITLDRQLESRHVNIANLWPFSRKVMEGNIIGDILMEIERLKGVPFSKVMYKERTGEHAE